MEVQQLLSVREIDIETLVLWRVFGIFLFTSLHSLSVLKLSMLIYTLTKSQATCALWALLQFLLKKKCFQFLLKKNGAGSLRKLVCELPDEFSKSHASNAKCCANFPTDEDKWSLPWCKFEFCVLLDITGNLTTKFLCQLFFNNKDISNVSSHDPLCLFCLGFSIRVSADTSNIHFFSFLTKLYKVPKTREAQ